MGLNKKKKKKMMCVSSSLREFFSTCVVVYSFTSPGLYYLPFNVFFYIFSPSVCLCYISVIKLDILSFMIDAEF